MGTTALFVERPQGLVFIRFAGQAAAVEANREAFMQVIRGLREESPLARPGAASGGR